MTSVQKLNLPNRKNASRSALKREEKERIDSVHIRHFKLVWFLSSSFLHDKKTVIQLQCLDAFYSEQMLNGSFTKSIKSGLVLFTI